MIWAILAASSIGVLIALLGFRMPMLLAAAVIGLIALFVTAMLGGHGMVSSAAHAIVGIIFLQLSYVAGAALIVWSSEGRALQRTAGDPSRGLLSFFRR